MTEIIHIIMGGALIVISGIIMIILAAFSMEEKFDKIASIGLVLFILGLVIIFIGVGIITLERLSLQDEVKSATCEELELFKDIEKYQRVSNLIKSEFVNDCVLELQWWEK